MVNPYSNDSCAYTTLYTYKYLYHPARFWCDTSRGKASVKVMSEFVEGSPRLYAARRCLFALRSCSMNMKVTKIVSTICSPAGVISSVAGWGAPIIPKLLLLDCATVVFSSFVTSCHDSCWRGEFVTIEH
jgi:hypothetical protein